MSLSGEQEVVVDVSSARTVIVCLPTAAKMCRSQIGSRGSDAGEITVRKMMGDYCIYCDGIIFGLICDDNLYVKITDAGREVVKEVVICPPYEGAKDIEKFLKEIYHQQVGLLHHYHYL